MAISAYDTKGRLKKNALLGSSFAADPTKTKQRAAFKTLKGEARTQRLGKSQMTDRLRDRFSKFSGAQAGRLGEIASKKRSLETEMAGFRDRDKETALSKELSDWTSWTDARSELNPNDTRGYGLTAYDPPINEEYRTQADAARNAIMALPQQQRYDEMLKWEREHSKVMTADNFAPEWFKKNIGSAPKRKAEYDANLAKQAERIDLQYKPLQQEEAERKKRLQDRMEIYNLFLGA